MAGDAAQQRHEMDELCLAILLAYRGDAPSKHRECLCGLWVHLSEVYDHSLSCLDLRNYASEIPTSPLSLLEDGA